MSLKLLIIGKTGQLARALVRHTAGSDFETVFLDRNQCDLAAPSDTLHNILEAQDKPDILINAAAYTAVDNAENDTETAFAVNGAAPTAIANFCAANDIPFIHVSTDYVFDGENTRPYLTTHTTGPIGVYGASKLAGEKGIIESGCKATIIRTSWVFDGTGKNFLTTMLRLAKDRDSLNVVSDQIGRPTYAGHLAQAVLAAARGPNKNAKSATRVFHVSGAGEPISWADFAASIFEYSNEVKKEMKIIGIPTSDYPTPAARPKFSVMDISAFEDVYGYSLPSWKEGLREALAERGENKR